MYDSIGCIKSIYPNTMYPHLTLIQPMQHVNYSYNIIKSIIF